MTTESLAIIAVILVACGVFLRTKKKAVVILTLPLISVPLFYLSARGIYALTPITEMTYPVFSCCMVIAGAVMGSAACGLLSFIIPTRRGKTGYLSFSLIFELAIAIGYMLNIL